MRPIKRVAVIGATGMLGLPVAAALAEAGFEVTALVRNPKVARGVLPSAIAVVEADVRDEESLRAGLRGHDALYLSLSVAPGEGERELHTEQQGLANIISTSRDAGVTRIAYLSALIRDTDRGRWWVIEVWRQALERIKRSGIPYTIFYPTNFMETLAQRHSAGRFVVMVGRARHPNYWIAAGDFGKQVAQALSLPQAANREYIIQGPEPMTYDAALARYAKALSPPAHMVRLPLSLLRLGGIVSRQLDFDAHIMDAVLSYPEAFKAGKTWAELGKPSTTIEAFAAQQQQRGPARG